LKAWLFTSPDQPLTLIERDDPQPGPHEVVIDVVAAGMCHTDVGVLDGTLFSRFPGTLPAILGHEIAGVVSAIGADVTQRRVGDRVVSAPTGVPYPGYGRDGGYATKCVVKESSAYPVPAGIDMAQAAAATDAGCGALGAVDDAQIVPGARVGIVGLGGAGLTGARIAVLRGAEVYAAEPRREVWELARERGVVEVFESVEDFEGLELDTVIDFVGAGTAAHALQVVRREGLVVQFGVHNTDVTIDAAALVRRRLTLKGSSRAGDLGQLFRWMADGELSIETTIVGFDDIPATLARLSQGGVIGRAVALIGAVDP
jgi:propanol-preferring alcohol dehydrogenase